MSKNSPNGLKAPPFQQIQPPGIIRATHGHVVGHDVEDQPHPLCAQGIDQTPQRRLATQLGIDRCRVHHVVAMQGAGAGGQQGRGIYVADAQAGKVRHQRHRLDPG